MDKWQLAVYVLEVFQRDVYPSEELIDVLEPYVVQMRAEYEAVKRKVGFQEANRAAQAAFLRRIEATP